MKDVCWLHYKEFDLGGRCPECLKCEQEYKRSLVAAEDEPLASAKKREPGDRLWGICRALVLVNVVLWVMVVLGAILMTGGK